jgi:integrase/recombinase XerD
MGGKNWRKNVNSTSEDQLLSDILQGFLLDRRAQGISHKTIQLYNKELSYFTKFLDSKGVKTISGLTASVVRQYLAELSTHRSPAGCHIPYRIIKSLTYWWEAENPDYVSPMHRVKGPKLDKKLLEPADLGDVRKMVDACRGPNVLRDKAILHFLLDTGCRANEILSMDVSDLDIERGNVQVRYGKGKKQRIVIFGKSSRRALRAYLKHRKDKCPALWITDEKQRLTYSGLRQIVRRAAERAGVQEPSLHSFRRAFVVAMLRKRVNIMTIRNLMGHADLRILERYSNQNQVELEDAYRDGSPGDLV